MVVVPSNTRRGYVTSYDMRSDIHHFSLSGIPFRFATESLGVYDVQWKTFRIRNALRGLLKTKSDSINKRRWNFEHAILWGP